MSIANLAMAVDYQARLHIHSILFINNCLRDREELFTGC
jgi:hypothetical protein